MSTKAYSYSGPVDCSVAPDKSQCRAKSVVVTGGAAGIGEAYVRGFVEAGAFVTFCDINEEKGKQLEDELSSAKAVFVKCDTRSWEDQVRLFDIAVSMSPHKSVDMVIANAGVGRGSGDPLMPLEDPFAKPTKPSMHIIDINLIGVMYTFKLAVHYFRRSPLEAQRDRCFIFGGSLVGYVDNLSSWEYSAAKFGLRGMMRSVRRQCHHQGIRVAYIAPTYVRTVIQSATIYEAMRDKGIEFATVESCLAAAMRVSCDKSINGRSFAIVPYSQAKEGFIDIDEDDFQGGKEFLSTFQSAVIRLRGDGWN